MPLYGTSLYLILQSNSMSYEDDVRSQIEICQKLSYLRRLSKSWVWGAKSVRWCLWGRKVLLIYLLGWIGMNNIKLNQNDEQNVTRGVLCFSNR